MVRKRERLLPDPSRDRAARAELAPTSFVTAAPQSHPCAMPLLSPEQMKREHVDVLVAIALGKACPKGLSGWGQALYRFNMRERDRKAAAKARADGSIKKKLRPRK